MKKYLMKGFAAIVFCGAIASCSHDIDSGSDAVQSKVQETYEKAFVTRFGTPASTQTWGFGTSAKANTRATGAFADHVGAYPDANDWTRDGFLAPDPLTQSQKLRAQYYFQMNHIVNPNRPDYGTRDFFIQQVYDGGTDPMAGKSAEVYDAADGSTKINSGEHMDHLTAGPGHLHIFNFNNGTCSTNGNVANRDQTDVNNTSQQHSDEIQLMLNTPTSCFGYANSDASCVRDDRWTLVSAATIDDFCDHDPGFSAWLEDRLTDERGDVKCDDDFHRDYIGFDFDMIPDELIFSGTQIWEQDPNVSWYSMIYKGMSYSEWDYYRYDLYGAKYHYVSANRNQYCGESKTIDPEPSDADALTLLQNGWLPASGSANKTWVKVGGCNDGYFSDWIVTFMPADAGDEEEVDEIVVLAEDLTIDDARPDFDFNDVVFKVTQYKSGAKSGQVWVTLLAAGGTLPLTVDGHEVHEEFANANPDKTILVTTMINTAKNGHTAYKTASFQVTNPRGSNIQEIANNIPVVVTKFGEQIPLVAPTGGVPSKIAVKTDFLTDPEMGWCDERKDIDEKYNVQGTPLFKSYVRGELDDNWYTLITTKGNQ